MTQGEAQHITSQKRVINLDKCLHTKLTLNWKKEKERCVHFGR